MQMTEEEICRRYREAKKKTSQIGILADLNAATTADIKEILERRGEMGRPRLNASPKKAAVINEDFAAAVDEMQGKRVAMPDVVKETIQFGIDALDLKISESEAQVEELRAKIAELKEKKRSITEYMKRSV